MPGFDEGGTEVHVLNLIRQMSGRGHEVTLASSGGRLEHSLPPSARILHMPADKKNPVTIIYCAVKLAVLSRKYRWDIIHAHSRVPAWISWLLSWMTGVPWVVTAHALYSLNLGITPLKHADGAICISQAVKKHLVNHLPPDTVIIPNGIIPPKLRHKDFPHDETKFLAVGRLTHLKGLDVAMRALALLKGHEWTLDVLGEGDERVNLGGLARELGIGERVRFLGDRDRPEVERYMARSSCLLFPSYSEGMGLVVLEALSVGLPVIASDLEALREFADGELVPAGNVDAWRRAIERFIVSGEACRFDAGRIVTAGEMAGRVEEYYRKKISLHRS
ncbi:MAG: glycosyltransferase family 4 protein [Synergistaceae bacterium]|nr:glycosyltransferase family 4 protein [Synergistaceae bacterium]MBQ7170577.1 glycosyltransferase family 4 protein [Synergistaceae bacterium]